MAAVLTIGAVQAPHASARSGVVGPVDAPYSVCQVSFGAKYVYVAVPNIYASNRTAGSGNDLQYVQYWTRLLYANGQPMTNWTAAGGAWANDNAPAALPVNGTFIGWPYFSTRYHSKWGPVALTTGATAQYSVAWYDRSLRLIGTNEYTVPGFNGTNVTGFIGTAPIC